MREHGCPWGVSVTRKASRAGHHELLKWLIAEGCPYKKSRKE